MEQIRLTLSANAGIAVELAGTRLLIDALHDRPVPGFSTLTSQMVARLWEHDAFRQPDAILYTHCHDDHYSPALAERALTRWPQTALFLPEPDFPAQTLLQGASLTAAVGSVTLRFFRLPHEREEYRAVPHYGVLLSGGGRNLLFAGDCAVAAPELAEALEGVAVDLAVLNFPWVTLPRGQRFVETYLRPAHLAICHLPFSADDPVGYRAATQKAVRRLTCPDVRILGDFLQTEIF